MTWITNVNGAGQRFCGWVCLTCNAELGVSDARVQIPRARPACPSGEHQIRDVLIDIRLNQRFWVCTRRCPRDIPEVCGNCGRQPIPQFIVEISDSRDIPDVVQIDDSPRQDEIADVVQNRFRLEQEMVEQEMHMLEEIANRRSVEALIDDIHELVAIADNANDQL